MMDRTLVPLDAQFDTLDAHVEGVGNAAEAGLSAGMPELAPFVAELAIESPDMAPTPLPQNEEEMDSVIFSALVSPYV
jgi:hypothetical protein